MIQKTRFVCQECGFTSPKWMGKCPGCGEWNSMVEEPVVKKKEEKAPERKNFPTLLAEVGFSAEERTTTKISELDQVLGGGIVKGSVVLLGGDPGIGKSTLALQIIKNVAPPLKTLYVSGEESKAQIKMRANRLKIDGTNILVLTETEILSIIKSIEETLPHLVVIDSIQTMYTPNLESSPGSVAQVREVASLLQRIAKEKGITMFIIGHVTKYGAIAGPKTLEHIVDTVLYLEGERSQQFRILRCIKNRFGATNEVGIFEMTQEGLQEVKNPSLLFIEDSKEEKSGSVVTAIMEGTRPLLVEIQALTAPTLFPIPQRITTGFPHYRFAMLLAVLAQRGRIHIQNLDTYLNVVGGIKIEEPSADLAVVLAVASSAKNKPIPSRLIAVGEVGLEGGVRSVPQVETRIKEGEKLGFKKMIIPARTKIGKAGIDLIKVNTIQEALEYV